MKILREFILFGIAGTLGFVVDTAVLYLLNPALGPFYGRAVSFFAAVVTTWSINRAFAFKGRKSAYSRTREFAYYFVLMLTGGVANYGAYSWLVVSYPLVREHLIIGVAIGSLAGMTINFLVSRFLLYRHSV